MIKRTVVGLILVPMLFLVTLWAPEIVLAGFCSAFAAIAVNELLYNTGLVRNPRMLLYTMIMAFLVPLWSFCGCPNGPALVGALLFYVALFSELLLSKAKIPFAHAALCMFGGVLIPYLFASLVRTQIMENGRYFIMLPFVLGFATDIGGYFVGVTMGKHKLCPVVSPKKTIEGLIGGIALAIICMVSYCLILQFGFGFRISYFYAVVYGIVGSLAAVIGDLSFSVIKRQTAIKDYGHLIPGHGGILDRFDSVIVVAPLVEALLLILPFACKG